MSDTMSNLFSVHLNAKLQSIPGARELLEFIRSPAIVAKLIQASEAGRPAVVGISHDLIERFPSRVRSVRAKQFIGMVCRYELENAGFEIASQGVKILKDPLFASGTRYRRRQSVGMTAGVFHPGTSSSSEGLGEYGDLIARLLACLTAHELSKLVEILNSELLKRGSGQAQTQVRSS